MYSYFFKAIFNGIIHFRDEVSPPRWYDFGKGNSYHKGISLTWKALSGFALVNLDPRYVVWNIQILYCHLAVAWFGSITSVMLLMLLVDVPVSKPDWSASMRRMEVGARRAEGLPM